MTLREGIARARQQARALQYRLGVTSARHIDIHEFAARLNVQIVDAPLEGALAQLIVNGLSARILLSSRLRDPARRRVAIAHELGHYVLSHPSPILATLCEPGSHPSHGSSEARDVEREANSFAHELLMPAAEVDALCYVREPDLRLARRLEITASVPIEHAAMRVVERSDRVCAVVLSTSGGITCVMLSDRFTSTFGPSLTSTLREGAPLDPRTLARQIRDGSVPHCSSEIAAQAWLGAPGLPLLESSTALEDGTILTMLWSMRIGDVSASARSEAAAS